ncbi:MAG: tyrosine-type recombinase/integrase [Burkholderiales bacterium]
MGELRDRMVRDMDVRHLSGRTVEAYLAGVKGLAKYYMRAPDQLSDEEVQRYLLHLREVRQLSSSSCNQIRCALKFFYEVTVRRPQASLTVPPMRQAQKLPEILSREEVERIVAATRTRRERVLLMAAYGSGLRVSEVVALRPADLDVERGVIRVVQGKGKKDRYTVLAERLVREVGQYYATYGRPQHWVFAQRHDASRHMDTSSAQKIYYTAKRRAGIKKQGGIHALRHGFATHSLEAGLDLPTLGRMLGHSSVTTTMRYLHTTTQRVSAQISPLDRLLLGKPPEDEPPTSRTM